MMGQRTASKNSDATLVQMTLVTRQRPTIADSAISIVLGGEDYKGLVGALEFIRRPEHVSDRVIPLFDFRGET